MPTYEYKCKTCGKEFEYIQKITDNAFKSCPTEICEQEVKGMGHVERKISKNIGLVFNGSGFYITDYAHKHTSGGSNGVKHSSEHESGNDSSLPPVVCDGSCGKKAEPIKEVAKAS
jgi:putative FmdB family regulatory protein